MDTILKSERLSLAPLAASDLDLAIEMFTSPAVTRYAGGVMSPVDIGRELPTWTKRGGDGCIGVWSVSDRETGEKYGSGCLLPMPIHESDTEWDRVIPGVMPDGDVEVGYFLKESAWGRGYATEICRRLIRFAFESTDLDEVVATFDDDNAASKRVLEKSGLSERGRRMAYGQDAPDWRIRRAEWVARVAEGG